jgi:hypothetical protein
MGQKKALLPFFTLGYVGLGRLVALLLTTFLGSVAFPAAVGTHIIVARLALAFPPPPSPCRLYSCHHRRSLHHDESRSWIRTHPWSSFGPSPVSPALNAMSLSSR